MRRRFWLALCSSLGVAAGGCVATIEPNPLYAEATYVPADIETYPYVVYEGRPVYYVDGYWYVHRGPSWAYYRREPPYLYRQRTYVRQAPRSYPARRPEFASPPVRSAPPAQRVR